MKAKYYVYVYYDPRNGNPIYVGMGQGKRAFKHWKRGANNEFFQNVLNKIRQIGLTPRIEFVALDLFAHEAKVLEKQLIQLYGRRDLGLGTLLNMTDGGDGASGMVMDSEHKNILNESRKAFWENVDRVEHGRKISQVFASRTPDELAVVSKNISLSRTDQVKKKIGNATRQRMQDPEFKKKVINALQTDESRLKRSKTMKETLGNQEKRKQMSNTAKKNWENPEYALKVSAAIKRSWERRKAVKSLPTNSVS